MIRPSFKWLLLTFVILNFTASFSRAEGFTLITKDQLKEEIDKPSVTIIDVRSPHHWDSSQMKIQGARREIPSEAGQWMSNYQKDRTIVLYCA